MFGIAYILGVLIFGVLMIAGMKICDIIDPEPPRIPDDIWNEYEEKCDIVLNGKTYNSIRTTKIRRTYSYDYDCNVIEHKTKFFYYYVSDDIYKHGLYGKKFFILDKTENKEFECYLCNGGHTISTYSPIDGEVTYLQRRKKLFRRKTA